MVTPKGVIKAARNKLTPWCRHNPKQRLARKIYYRKMLAYHKEHQELLARYKL